MQPLKASVVREVVLPVVDKMPVFRMSTKACPRRSDAGGGRPTRVRDMRFDAPGDVTEVGLLNHNPTYVSVMKE